MREIRVGDLAGVPLFGDACSVEASLSCKQAVVSATLTVSTIYPVAQQNQSASLRRKRPTVQFESGKTIFMDRSADKRAASVLKTGVTPQLGLGEHDLSDPPVYRFISKQE